MNLARAAQPSTRRLARSPELHFLMHYGRDGSGLSHKAVIVQIDASLTRLAPRSACCPVSDNVSVLP